MAPPASLERPPSAKKGAAPVEKRLAQAVRNSLNLPQLRVRVRQNKTRGSWSFLLQEGRARSEWVELDSGAVSIMKKLVLVPALHLGTFRLAYAALRSKKSESRSQESE